jgi:hypothetical protein
MREGAPAAFATGFASRTLFTSTAIAVDAILDGGDALAEDDGGKGRDSHEKTHETLRSGANRFGRFLDLGGGGSYRGSGQGSDGGSPSGGLHGTGSRC